MRTDWRASSRQARRQADPSERVSVRAIPPPRHPATPEGRAEETATRPDDAHPPPIASPPRAVSSTRCAHDGLARLASSRRTATFELLLRPQSRGEPERPRPAARRTDESDTSRGSPQARARPRACPAPQVRGGMASSRREISVAAQSAQLRWRQTSDRRQMQGNGRGDTVCQ